MTMTTKKEEVREAAAAEAAAAALFTHTSVLPWAEALRASIRRSKAWRIYPPKPAAAPAFRSRLAATGVEKTEEEEGEKEGRKID